MRKKWIVVFLLLLAMAFFPGQQVKADAGPEPPSMTFYFDMPPGYDVVDAEIRICTTPSCEQFTVFPPEDPEPWERLWCENAKCLAVSIGSRNYFQLVAHFSNGETLVSNVFRDWSYAATYHVHMQEGALIVEEERKCCSFAMIGLWDFCLFWPMLGFTSAVEIMAAIAYTIRRLKRRDNLLAVILIGELANFLSFPIVWFVFPYFFYTTPDVWIAAEAFAFVFEGILFFLMRRRMGISGKQAFVLSAVMNAASVLAAVMMIAGLDVLFWLVD